MEQEWLVYVDAGPVSWLRPEDKAGNAKTYWIEERDWPG